jgi:methylisocitrate lyase
VVSNVSPGRRFREALASERPLRIVGAINAYFALLAEHTGFRAVYVSGAGVANASYGLPDLGMTSLEDVCIDVRRITYATDLPVLVDMDTGWGHAHSIARAVRELHRAGAAAVHIEDQVAAKRCGHRPGKQLVPTEEMVDRVTAAVDAKPDQDMLVIARTDAVASEGLEAAVKRAVAYREAGADAIFAEAVTQLDDYRRFVDEVGVPVLANLTEFGRTPGFTPDELAQVGVAMALFPLSAFRAAAAAAEATYRAIRTDGHVGAVLDRMQTRAELYEHLGYLDYERKLDELFGTDDDKQEEG